MRPFFEERHFLLQEELEQIESLPEGDREAAEIMGSKEGGLDLYRFLLPEEGPVDTRALCIIRERLGYLSPLADSIFAVQGLGSYPIALAGSEDQRSRLLDSMRRGERIGAFALTEPEAGSDVASMRAEARPLQGGGFSLHGEKTFISNVGIADGYVVFCKVPGDDGAGGKKPHRLIRAFYVESGSEGLTEEPIPMGIEHPIGRLRFEGCEVPADAALGDPGGGFRLAMQTLDTFRISVGAAAVGMAQRALDEALAHVTTRRQFGRPLSDQQLIQGALAEMATELSAARLLVLRAAYEKDQGDRPRVSREAAMAKLFATEAAQRVVDRAVQLFGGRGVVQGEVVESLYRAIRPLRIYEGTSEIQKLIIAKDLIKSGA